ARDYTQRVLEGGAATTFKWIDAILTLFPLVIVSWVLISLARKIFAEYPVSIFFTALSFLIICGLGLWKINREFSALETEVAASWFQLLNSLFIIRLGSLFSRMREPLVNPTVQIKFRIGLILLVTGFP